MKLPPADARVLSGFLAASNAVSQDREVRVSVLLWLGRNREAMEAATSGADKPPADAKSERKRVMLEAARVFKAHDLSLRRANAYLAWAGNPEGQSPVEAFLRETPAWEGTAKEAVPAGGAP